MPLKGDYGPAEAGIDAKVPENAGFATLGKLGLSGSLFLGSWIPDVMAHGTREPSLAATAAEREDRGKQGKMEIDTIVRRLRIPEALEALRQHDRFTQDVIVPKLGKYLPAVDDDH